MAKLNSMFSFHGTLNEVTEVRSRRYGKHIRRPRGTVKPIVLNESFQKSVELNNLANPAAKAIKDALDPFRKNLKDGTMWSRLVGLFKKQLRQNTIHDFSILENFEMHDKYRLRRNYEIETSVNFPEGVEPSVRITLSSRGFNYLEKFKASSYRQTLIAIFLNDQLQATTCVEHAMLPLSKKPGQQIVQWSVPTGTKSIVIAVKGEGYRDHEPIGAMKVSGLAVVKVLKC